MQHINFPTNDKVLVGKGTADDAGVYLIDKTTALVQTVDFFTPIVDDPYQFGQIAAANSLSDIYAMGGRPITAMNIIAYPIESMGLEPLKAILAGGADKITEAEAVLLGGHSVEDEEIKYGLSVTGTVHPDRIWKNQGLQSGDLLILTKAIGTGIINTAIKGGLASNDEVKKAYQVMSALNQKAAKVLADFPVSACTDITGFGLLGHLAEMLDGCRRSARLDSRAVPILDGGYHYASMGLVPIGTHHNRKYRQEMVQLPDDFDPILRDILFDPQTSGGLLCGCPADKAADMLRQLEDAGIEHAAIIGEIIESDTAKVIIS